MTISVAVLGCGRIGAMHAEYLHRRVEQTTVSAVFDVFAESASAVSDLLGVPVAADLDEIWNSDCDAVAICTSTDTHVDLIVAAAAAGKQIFCEKPVSQDLAEVDRALAAVEAAGVKLHVGFNRRFDPSHKAVADAVKDDRIGGVHLVTITSRDPAPPPIEYIKVSGGIFKDMAVHDFDMARYVTGSEVVEVYARGAVRVDPAIGEAGDIDTTTIVLTHEDGTLTTINNSRKAVYGYDQRVEVFGAGGMVASDNYTEHNARISTADGLFDAPLQHFFLERYTTSYLDQWAAFAEAIEHGTEVPVTGTDGRAPLVMALAAQQSFDENRPVRCSEIG